MKLRWSIRTQLFALVVAVVLPFIGLLAYTTYTNAEADAQQARAAALNIAQLTAAHTQQFIAESASTLAQLAQRPLIRAALSRSPERSEGAAEGPAACDPILAELHALDPTFTNIGLINLDGLVICSAVPQPGGQPVSVAAFPWFQNAKRAGQFTVGEPHVGPITGKWVSALTQPVHDDAGNLVGILAMTIDLVRYQSAFGGVNLPPGSVVKILDDNGTVIARWPEPEKWVGKNLRGTEIIDLVLATREGQAQVRGVDGVERVYGFTTIPIANWHAYAGIPTDVVYAPVRDTILHNSLFGLLITLLALLLAYSLQNRITWPLRLLAHTAQAVAQGRMETRAPVSGSAEIVEVATEFNRMLAALRRTTRALRVRGETNATLIHSASEGDLLDMICRIAVEEGGYRFAWFGVAEQDENKTVRPVAQHGFEEGYLDTLNITWADTERGRGPTGTAIRTGQVCLARNIPGDPNYAPWRAAAIQRGYASSIALPLKLQTSEVSKTSEVWGTLNIYAAEPDAFDDDEVKLLAELANDLAYGIASLRARAERDRAEEALRESEARFKAIASNTPDHILMQDRELRYTFVVNPQLGLTEQDMLGKTDYDFLPKEEADRLTQVKRQVLETGKAVHLETSLISKAGEAEFFDGSYVPRFDAQGQVEGLIGYFRNVTDRKRAEESLKKTTQALQSIIAASPAAIVSFDPEGCVLSWNPAAERVFGWKAEEVTGKIAPHIGAEHLAEFHALRQRVIQSEVLEQMELMRTKKDGTPITINLSTAPNFDEKGNPIGYTAIITDITDRKRAETELRLREHQLSLIYDSVGDILYYLKVEPGPHYRFLTVNSAFLKATGLTAEQIVGKTINEVIPEPSLQLVRSNYEQAIREKRIVYWEEISQYPAGLKTGIVSIAPVFDDKGNCTHLVGSVHDITERKRAEQALRRSEAHLEEAQRIAHVGSWEWVAATDTPTWSRELCAILEVDPDKPVPSMAEQDRLYTPDSMVRMRTAVERTMRTGEPYEIELERVRADGSRKWLLARGERWYDEKGQLVGLRGTALDITERKQAEEEIRQRAEELATLNALGRQVSQTLSLDKVVAATVDEIVKAVQPDVAFLFLREGEQLLLKGIAPASGKERLGAIPEHRVGECICGLTVREGRALYSRDIFADLRCTWDECKKAGFRSFAALPLQSGEEIIGVVGLAALVERDFEQQAKFLETLASQVAIGIRNVLLYEQVQRHAAELERRVAERTAELTIAKERAEYADHLKSAFLATMSHELRTPLNSIIGFTGMLLERWAGPLNEEQDKQLKMVYNSAKHLLALINDILDLSKIEAGQLELHPSSFALPDLITEVMRTMYQQAAAKGLELAAQFDPGVGAITADRRRLEQVLLNLVGNAIKFTEAGQVTIKTLSKIEKPRPRILIQVTDAGIGIRAEDMNKLFQEFRQLEPIRTRRYEGTGLGLAICKKLVTMMGGEIWAESEGPGKGSTFTVELPVE